jgi:DNA-directed RNA polymerase specialized sigma24 family protein
MRVWLVRIAWNLALDRKRRKRPEQLDEYFANSLASATMPADEAMEEAQRLAVRALLSRARARLRDRISRHAALD